MNPKVLIAEDDEFLRDLYVETLQSEHYQVEIAKDGQEAYDKLMVGGWDLVLLDIIMPKMNGLEVMKKIKASPQAKPSKCVIFTTNLDKDEELKEAKTLGDGYLIKSQLTPGDLLIQVKQFLSHYAVPLSQQPTEQSQN